MAFDKPFHRANLEHARRASKRAWAAIYAFVTQRDGGACRVPWCRTVRFVERAHLAARGMGGDHGRRTTCENVLLLCRDHHRAYHGWTKPKLFLEGLTDRGADGPMRYRQGKNHADDPPDVRVDGAVDADSARVV